MTDFRPCSQDTGPRAASATGVKPVARLAWLIVAYNIVIILWGAYVRVSGSGAGCGSRWPLCNGEILPSGTQFQTLIEFVHRVTSALSLVIVSFLVVWCWRRTSKGDWARYSSVCGLFLLFNEALLGALLVLSDHVGLDPSAAHALFLCLHFGNTLLLLAALTLTARWLSNRKRRFVVVRKPQERIAIGLGLVSVMAIGMTGSLASLGDTIFPVGSLRHALMQDFSSSSHVLLRLRLLHPVAAVIGSLYVLWLLWNLQGKRDWSASRLVLGATLMAQIVVGLMNVILLTPVWLQMTHLLVAELFWVLLVVASAELLFVDQQWSGLARERKSEVTWRVVLKRAPRIRSSLTRIFEDHRKETLRAR
jgi:cytochrome c oxidase assembly protein subunit 15